MGERKAIRGVLTESCLGEAEEEFPGITQLFLALPQRSMTFLQLVWIYLANRDAAATAMPAALAA